MVSDSTLTIDGKIVAIQGERNLLELVRKANIDLPTFCYHSDLSVYGACRLCLVDVQGRGIQAACSTPPQPDMIVRTQTQELREIRRISIELLLANHDQSCPTCPKSASCQLQALARRLGVQKVRFHSVHKPKPVDRSTPSLVRDPNKCVLCGDCVRVCNEIQGVGAIDFAHRGSNVCVVPAFGKDLAGVECVHCGQCASVCPTGALTPASASDDVFAALDKPELTVVAQIAPAVRVALGELFGMAAGELATGHIVAALKQMGFKQVYDTAFAADLTVLEEATEFLKRKTSGQKLPQFTSCCPAWVKFAEQYYPQLLGHLSSCRSPQQMFGSLARQILPKLLGIQPENLVVVSIMPCTAKKFEAGRPEFAPQGRRDVDHVVTTQELGLMIEQAGITFSKLQPESLDMPMGFKTGAGVIFGASGGVTEAVLRYAAEKISGSQLGSVDFQAVRGQEGLRTAVVDAGGVSLKLALVHGLRNARRLADQVRDGKCDYDLIEVMACPGGCIGGAGQPVSRDGGVRQRRARGLYDCDKTLQLHKSQDNPMVHDCYACHLGEIGSEKAHHLLHTKYHSRRRITDQDFQVTEAQDAAAPAAQVEVGVCVGTSCYVRGAQDLLSRLIRHIRDRGLEKVVDVRATFCYEACNRGPTVSFNGKAVEKCTFEKACAALEEELLKIPTP